MNQLAFNATEGKKNTELPGDFHDCGLKKKTVGTYHKCSLEHSGACSYRDGYSGQAIFGTAAVGEHCECGEAARQK